jgi:hypothetical protein
MKEEQPKGRAISSLNYSASMPKLNHHLSPKENPYYEVFDNRFFPMNKPKKLKKTLPPLN